MHAGVNKDDHWEMKNNVKETDEIWVVKKSNTQMGLAFFLFILLCRVKKKKKTFKHYENTILGRGKIIWSP